MYLSSDFSKIVKFIYDVLMIEEKKQASVHAKTSLHISHYMRVQKADQITGSLEGLK